MNTLTPIYIGPIHKIIEKYMDLGNSFKSNDLKKI